VSRERYEDWCDDRYFDGCRNFARLDAAKAKRARKAVKRARNALLTRLGASRWRANLVARALPHERKWDERWLELDDMSTWARLTMGALRCGENIDAYLRLEQVAADFEVDGCPDFAERCHEIMDDLWLRLSDDEVRRLNERDAVGAG